MKKLLARFFAWVRRVLRGRPDDQAVPVGGGGGGIEHEGNSVAPVLVPLQAT